MENKEKEFAAEYSSALLELKVNSRPLIMMLTDLAKENEIYAKIVAEVIIHYIYKRSYKLPALYLVDSIVKNVGMPYKRLFASSIDKVFPHVFEKVDEEGRRKLYKLRQTWNDVFPHSRLCYLDTKVHGIDPAWPVPPVPKTTSPNHQFKRQHHGRQRKYVLVHSTGTDCLRNQKASTLSTPPQDPRLNPYLKRKSLEKNHPKKKVKLSSESSDKPLITSESSEFKSQPVEKTVAVNENLSQKTSHHIKETSSENKKHYEVFGLFGKEDIDLRQKQTIHQLPHSTEVKSPNPVLCLAQASQTRDKTASVSIDAGEKEVSNPSWKENINPIASKDMKNPLSLVEATQTREKSNFVIDTIENEFSCTQEKEKINSDASRDLKNSVLYSVQASQCEDKNSSMVIDTKENEASYTPWKEKTPVASKYMKNSMLSQIEDKTSPVVIDTSRKVVSCTLWKENISPVDHRDIKAFNPYIGSRYSDPGGSSGKDSWRREKIDHSYVNKKYSDHESVYTGSWRRSSYNNHSPNQEMNSPNYCNRNISKSGNVKYNGIELPSVSDKLLNIIQCEPQTKTIDIDGKPREIRVYGERAIILMDWDKPYTVSFESIQCNIIFDNGEYVFPIQIGEDYRVFFVNGENHRIKVGVPTHELMLDGKGYQCFFGNKPITVHFAGKHRTIGLDCRTPRVLFGRNINTEFLLGYVELTVDSKKVARLYLDAKPQVFMLEEKPYIIKFISAFQKVNINGAKFSVEFGGFPICILVEGARKYLRFSNLPSFVIPGITKVQGMDNEDLPDLPGPNYDSNTLSHGRVNRVPDYPSIPTCPPQSPSIVINNNSKPAQIPQAAPPVVNINAVFNIPPPTITADIPHQNVTPVNLNSSVNANSSFNTFPQKSEPSLTQKDISQHILPVLPLAHPSNTSIISGAYVSSLEFPSNLQHPPPMQSVITDNYQRPPLFPYPPPPLPSKVVTPFKEPTPPPTNPEDVHDLVNRLVKSGVIKNIKKVGKNKENEIKNNYKKKEDTMKNDSREIPNRLNFIDDIPVDSMMKVENLKRPNDKMKNFLISRRTMSYVWRKIL
ncbi:Pre-mRNA cleavage complex 2 protein Pcf11 [Armadillidium vulgare]|nr:Pre-mRNA cleavage complex 2 protein Pcf11 [Armadillidium vulgare]